MTTSVQNYLDMGLRGLWYPVLASWEVQSAPVGITRLGEQIVVWRNKDGQVQALEDRCPHRGVGLEWQPDQFLDPSNSLIQCATHGALFLIESGECVAGPCEGEWLEALACHEDAQGLWLMDSTTPADADR